MYKAVVLFISLLIFLGYLFISKPDTIVVDGTGKAEGLLNKGRVIIQGDRFWKYQLKMATELYNKNYTPKLPSSSEMQSLYRKVREDQRLLEEKMKVLYTPEEQTAKNLRMKADSIEITGKLRSIDDAAEAVRMLEMEKAKIIIPVLEKKLHIVNPQPATVTK
jgi:RNA polymerase-interacting CarD/CdnL/TRCF family regulator